MSVYIILDVVILCLFLIIGVPVPLCFAAAVLFLYLTGDFSSSGFLVSAGYSQMSSIILLAIPLYIIAGNIMSKGGIATRLIALAEVTVGRFTGGLGIVVIFSTAIFGAISGMASSAVAAIGSIMIPRMVERGYDKGYAASLVSCSAVLALLIPPSASMILYGWISGTSIIASFLAPKKAALGLFMPLIILGCIYGGITTPTEAAAIAVLYAIPLSIYIYKEMNYKQLYTVLWESGKITGILLVLVFFASMLSRMFTMENVPQLLLESFTTISENKILVLLLVNVFLLMVGMFMDDVSGILLATPMLMPVMHGLDVDSVQFAAIIATGHIGKASLKSMLSPTFYFLFGAYLPVVLFTTFVPEASLLLPRLILGY